MGISMMASDDDRVGFEDQQLNGLDVIISDLVLDFRDDCFFTEIKNLSQSHLGRNSSSIKTGTEYFKILQNNLGDEDMLDFLINLTDFQNLHRDCGTEKVSRTLQSYKGKLEKYKQECMLKNIYDPNFVGRDGEIKDIMSLFQQRNSNITGKHTVTLYELQ